jgi:hypothetical protein
VPPGGSGSTSAIYARSAARPAGVIRYRAHTALYPGGYHGWDLVEDAPYAAKVRALVLAWLRAR